MYTWPILLSYFLHRGGHGGSRAARHVHAWNRIRLSAAEASIPGAFKQSKRGDIQGTENGHLLVRIQVGKRARRNPLIRRAEGCICNWRPVISPLSRTRETSKSVGEMPVSRPARRAIAKRQIVRPYMGSRNRRASRFTGVEGPQSITSNARKFIR